MSVFLLRPMVHAIAVGTLLAVGSLAAATNAAAAGLPVTVNGSDCGTYTDVSFNAQGHLVLAGNLSCTSVEETTPPDVKPPTTIDPPVSGGGAGSNTSGTSLCANPTGEYLKHDWNLNLSANARKPIKLSRSDTYSLQLTADVVAAGKEGYGTVRTHDLPGNIGTRTVVISECPNSLVPANESLASGYNPCTSVGAASTNITWAHDKKRITQCELQPGKDYYINVKHVQAPDMTIPTCKTGSCVFLLDYAVKESQ